jgi:hypothetical protein
MNAANAIIYEPSAFKRQTGRFPPLTTSISIQFVATSTFQIQIKKTNYMKTSAMTHNGTIVPSLFQIASYFEDFVPKAGLKRPALALSNTPFAELMLHPEKLEAVLKSAKTENDAFGTQSTEDQSPARPATRSGTPKKYEGGSVGKPVGHSPAKL